MFSRRFNILIVDDEAIFRTLISKSLIEGGYEVISAKDGLEAIELFDTHPVDLVVTDLLMPRMGGMELLKYFSKNQPALPVIIVTGYATLDTALTAIQEGVYDYITKPFQIDELLLTVRNAIERVSMMEDNQKLIEELTEAHEQLVDLENRCEAVRDDNSRMEIMQGHARLSERMNKLSSYQNRLLPFQYSSSSNNRSDVVSEISTLGSLANRGTITHEEFIQLKTRILEGK